MCIRDSLGVSGELLLLEPGEVDDASDSRGRLLKRTADLERPVGGDPGHRDDHGRIVVGADIEAYAAMASVDDVRLDLHHLAVDGRVDIGLGRCADIERSVLSSGSTRQLVVVAVSYTHLRAHET